jgi:L,D-transpeptidase ErfK/SrfK
MRRANSRVSFAVCLPFAAAACSIVHPCIAAAPAAPQAVAVVSAPAPALPAPVQTERFVLKPGQDVVGRVQIVRVAQGQTLSDIARLFDVGYDAMVHANPKVDPWVPPVGTPVIVPTQFILPDAPRRGIVVNVAALRLFYFPPHRPGRPQILITHPVGIGRVAWDTPEGVTRVISHVRNPIWFVPRSIQAEHARWGDPLPRAVGPGPDDPLGHYAMHLGWPGYLIHGTNKPIGVGQRVSHGCIHLYPEDIAQIFRMVPNGTQVRVVDQPYLFGWADGRLYMQAYGALRDDKRPWKTDAALLARMLPRGWVSRLTRTDEKIDWRRVRQLVAVPKVVPLPVSGRGPAQEGLVATLVQNRLPKGSAWNGKTELPLTNTQFNQIMSQIDATPAPKPGAGADSGFAHAATPAQPGAQQRGG